MSRPHFAECTMGKVAAESGTDGIDTRMRFTIAPPRALFRLACRKRRCAIRQAPWMFVASDQARGRVAAPRKAESRERA
jgi:hypothetical protein